MWLTFFRICDFLCNFIPSRNWRTNIRKMHLYDWRKKYNALRAQFPGLDFRHTKMIKGGWNIGFIVDNRFVFKVRKFDDTNSTEEKIMIQKRITDAFADISPIRIPRIEIVHAGGYMFSKYDFIPGKNLNLCSCKKIAKYSWQLSHQLGEFIYTIHTARPKEIADLETKNGDGWNHNDICNNVIVDSKTMEIVGLIDWEYAGWGYLKTEIENCTAFSKKLKKLHLETGVELIYILCERKNKRSTKNN